jgi:hypothetical protein
MKEIENALARLVFAHLGRVGLLSGFLGGIQRVGALCFWGRGRRDEPHQSCKPQSVPICPQQHISVLGSFLEAALLNFSPRLIELIG